MYEELVNEIIEGRRLGKEDDLTFLIDGDLESLCQGADKIRKELVIRWICAQLLMDVPDGAVKTAGSVPSRAIIIPEQKNMM